MTENLNQVKEIYSSGDLDVDFEKINDENSPNVIEEVPGNQIITESLNINRIFLKYNKLDRTISAFNENPTAFDQKESTSEKFNRINLDYQNLLQEIQTLQTINPQNKKEDMDSLHYDIKNIEKNISEIASIPNINLNNEQMMIIDQNVQFLEKQMQNQLNQTILEQLNKKIYTKEQIDRSYNIKYEIYLNQNQSDLKQIIQNQTFEQRIANLEQIIGTEKIPNKISITKRLEKLEDNCNNMTDLTSHEIMKKVDTINEEIDEINQKNEDVLEASEPMNNVISIIRSSNSTKSNKKIAAIVQRLETLSYLNNQSNSVLYLVENIQSVQTKIDKDLLENQEIINSIGQVFEKELTVQAQNIQNLDQMINNLN